MLTVDDGGDLHTYGLNFKNGDGTDDSPGDLYLDGGRTAAVSAAPSATAPQQTGQLRRYGHRLLANPPLARGAGGVRAGGFEPPRCCHQQDLNLPRLPFRHARVR
jgi:hypothetical protein